ncbi:IS66 family transposase [Echinicola soli]|uniref:IS66 family transposase n=1 Tax=Echinicola soli TaxID=2591634 RepID=UPI001E3352FF|nr:transposase [Echinicola soli]
MIAIFGLRIQVFRPYFGRYLVTGFNPDIWSYYLGKWLEENQYRYRPGSPLGKAIHYARSRWAGLSAYTLHGQMELNNNLVENAVRPLAIGRKAFLFAGSHQAVEMTAAMYSFMASCKKNNVNEFEWLKDVFERIQSHKQKDLYQLLPSNWVQYRPK